MLQARTLVILGILAALYVLVVLPAYFGPGFLAEIGGTVVLFTYLSIYLFHNAGIPGLLEHNGLCGWGWCSPTAFGWAFLAVFWVMVAWLLAWGLASLSRRWLRPPTSPRPPAPSR